MTKLELQGAKVFVLTGAGISASSGIKTFRDNNGLWRNHSIVDVASYRGFFRDPTRVWEFYSERREQASQCTPSKAHQALAGLQSIAEVFVATQNVDNLHELAGTKHMRHIHGELFKSTCSNLDCQASKSNTDDDRRPTKKHEIEQCQICGHFIRPDVVWFGEATRFHEETMLHLFNCTHFIAIGTSGNVFPAALYAQIATARGIPSIYIGTEEPNNAAAFSDVILGDADTVVPEILGI